METVPGSPDVLTAAKVDQKLRPRKTVVQCNKARKKGEEYAVRTQKLMEILAYLAFKTVGLTVDIAILIRQEALYPRDDIIGRQMEPVAFNPLYPSIQIPQGTVNPLLIGGIDS